MPSLTSSELRSAQLNLKHDLRVKKSTIKENLRSSEWRSTVLTLAGVISGYFLASVGLTFFQKRLISHLRFPITIVTCHLLLKFVLAGACRRFWTVCISPEGRSRVVLSWSNYMSKVALVAVFSALDIGLSQWSFEYITISLYTMTKTTAVLFLLMFALIFKLEKKHWSLIVIVIMISVGLFLFVFRSTTFNMIGFSMVLLASFLSGARWTLSQLIMQKGKLGLENPIDLIYHIQPLMVLTLIPCAAIFEGLTFASSEHAFRYHDYSTLFHTIGLILFGGLLAFVMEVFEFFIVTKASSLTLSIVGIIKEICSVLLDWYINDSELSAINGVGALICLSGIGIHIFRKASSPAEKKPRAYQRNRRSAGADMSIPLLSDNDSSEFSSDEEEMYHPGRTNLLQNGNRKSKSFRDFDDDFYLRDNREWTSVRDSHISMRNLTEVGAAPTIPAPKVLQMPHSKSEPVLNFEQETVDILADLSSD